MKSTMTKLSEDNFNVYAFDENDQFNTVLDHFKKSLSETKYDYESDLEKDFIKKLVSLGYEYSQIHNCDELLKNLKIQLEKLNQITFNDNEWKRICSKYLHLEEDNNESFVTRTKFIQKDPRFSFKFDDGKEINLKLIDKDNYNNNHLQVINQFIPNNAKYNNRYDVTILINGLPIVHIELKTYKTNIKQAFNQIDRYKYESFNDCKLFQFIQLFVISNETETKYFSNTTFSYAAKNNSDFSLTSDDFKSNSSFAFTIFWADQKNNKITYLFDFAESFLNKRTLQKVLFRYCVFTANDELKVMRPYQIAACEKILQKINLIYKNFKNRESLKLPDDPNTNKPIKAGGYIWHATGSGKTLTSFKTAELVSKFSYIDKVIFVVDRKDLDYQTLSEYKKYNAQLIDDYTTQATSGSIKISATKNSSKLLQLLKENTSDEKIIITTIQKLSRVLKQNKEDRLNDDIKKQLSEILKKRYVFILDECHRSTFGKMFSEIQKNFKYYYLFGFTGTPIFEENKKENNNALNDSKTTEELFGECLHSYTIYHALKDQKVLPFLVHWTQTTKACNNNEEFLDNKEFIYVNERIKNNCQYILEKYNTLTKANHTSNNSNKVQKFNAILACKDIDLAKIYYIKLKELINANLYPNSTLKKVGIIYSYVQNPDEEDNSKDFDTKNLEPNDKYFLEGAIKDYNQLFNANFSINTFNNYYRDVSKRLKEQELDLLIVVNMFLTGFDSPSLNTIFIDKKLRFHELIQTYSRTNRILDSIKDCGNVVNFQEFRKEQNEAYKLYSNESDIVSLIELRDKKSYIDGYIDENGKYHKGLKDIVNEIEEKFPDPSQIREEDIDKQKEFINLQTSYLRLVNKLSSFVDLKEEELNKLLLNHENEYKGVYNNLKAEFKKKYEQTGDSSIFNNVEFEKQLIEITDTIDEKYIFNLIKDCIVLNKTNNASFNKLTKEQIKDIILKISASPEVENKKEAYEEFLNKVDLNEIDTPNIFDLLFNKLSKFKPEFATKKLNELEKKYTLKHDGVIKLFKYWTKNNNYEFNGKKTLEISLDVKVLINNIKNNRNFYDEYKRKIRQELINFYSTYWNWLNVVKP